jgi:hypothetical protein
MSDAGRKQPSEHERQKPPRRFWYASEPFFDLKASHWVEIFLTLALLGVGASQLAVYWIQTQISETVERPWIAIENVEVTKPLSFKENFGILTVKFSLKNTGHVPAANVLQDGMLFMRAPVPVELLKIWERCEAFRKQPLETRGSGVSIFPDQLMPAASWYKMAPVDVERLNSKPMNGTPTLAGCIDYAFIGETRRHQTRFVYEVNKKGPNDAVLSINPGEGDISAPDVMLMINPALAGTPD